MEQHHLCRFFVTLQKSCFWLIRGVAKCRDVVVVLPTHIIDPLHYIIILHNYIGAAPLTILIKLSTPK